MVVDLSTLFFSYIFFFFVFVANIKLSRRFLLAMVANVSIESGPSCVSLAWDYRLMICLVYRRPNLL